VKLTKINLSLFRFRLFVINLNIVNNAILKNGKRDREVNGYFDPSRNKKLIQIDISWDYTRLKDNFIIIKD
jgi:hypothetical protein